MKCIESLHNAVLLGRSRQGKAVDENVLLGYAVFHGAAQYLLRNGETSVGSLGDTALVEGKSHHRGTVLLYDGEYGVEGVVLAVHRVNNWLAVVYAETCLKHLGDSGVQLEGSVADALYSLYSRHHHFLFVDTGKSHIYVQYLGACVYLLNCLTEDIVHIMGEESFLEALLACGVDTLADNTGLVYIHAVHRRTGYACADYLSGLSLHARQGFCHGGDVLRCGAAAAAEYGDACLCQLYRAFRKVLGTYVVLIGHRVGETCIGLGYNGERGEGAYPVEDRKKLLGTQ